MPPGTVTRIGRYEIKSLIGAGGMGSLYLARDTNPNTNRLVALKVLNAYLDSGDLRERFAREARALAALNHPNIVDIYDAGDFHGSPYIVMEFVRGESLAEKIKRRAPLSMPQKLTTMIELCAGLAHAHDAGIIHRDIKPANLMVDLRGGLKILDFGIARVAEGSMTRAVQVTQVNMRIGTPGYMSPEQIEGAEIDRRSDIFAVGTVFYELLTYSAAFTGSTTRQIENKVLQAQPIPLPSLVPDLDPEIAAIVSRTLEKDPDKRYQDAESLQQDLEHQRWRLGPSRNTPAPARSAPSPAPGRLSGDSRADAAYQRSVAVFHDGAVEAARRFAIEALAEDPKHPGARELLERIDPRPLTLTTFPMGDSATPQGTAAATYVETVVDDAGETIVRTYVEHAVQPRPSKHDAVSWKRYQWPAIVAGAVILVLAIAIAVIRFAMPASGQTLTILRPNGGSILGRGITCGTLGSDCSAPRENGEAVELQAQADEGFVFAGYVGDCAPAGRMLMNGPRTCGAKFDRLPPPRPVVMRQFTVQRPRNGTIVSDVGITCGTNGADCTADVEQGRQVKLDVLPDPGYGFARYTGPCAPDGQTVMSEARTCGAQFTALVATAKPGGAAPVAVPPRGPATQSGSTAGGAPAPVPVSPPVSTASANTGDSGGSSAGSKVSPLGPGVGPAPPPEPPDETARKAIRRTLAAYCAAYEKRDADGIKRVFPDARVSQQQFRQLKKVECTFTGDPKFPELDPSAGKAKVEIDIKQVVDQTVGGTSTRETTNTLTMLRPEPRGEWLIQTLTAREKR